MIAALALVVATLAPGCLAPPVPGPVTQPFRAPACTYCPGHRGIEFGALAGTPVRAVVAGTVTFAGKVAGTTYVVLAQADGLTATYGFLQAPAVRRGAVIAAGQEVGRSTQRVYFGWRQGDLPVDPTPVLGRWRGRSRLVPTDGSRGRPGGAGTVRLQCPSGLSEP
ncbi:MAG: M23 family metallopeptidase [Actinomycetota bacterium]|nr:M23 family metallopeptidase [Actinomycetota bacterium]